MASNLHSTTSGRFSRLRTPRGVAAAAMTAIFIAAGTSGHDSSGSLAALIIISPIGWWFWWWTIGLLSVLRGDLIRGKPPQIRVGRAWQPSGGTSRQQLRKDENAYVFSDRGGILLRKRRWFIASGTPPFEISGQRWQQVATAQHDEPQEMALFNDRFYWWYQDAFYWTNADYSAADIKALLFTRERQQERELEHAHAVLAASTSQARRKRESIPRDVRRAVWERDEGRCTECGTDFDIQYDHIIPFSMGGASTVENLQLLCAPCNQAKGGRL